MARTQDKRQKEKVARLLWEAGCVMIKARPAFRWASGIRSPIYTDNRLLLAHPRKRDAIVEACLALIRQQRLGHDQIAGVATAGIPLASILADRLNKPLLYVRLQPKGHGKRQQIEGQLRRGARVLLIEDLVSTGGSSRAAARALQRAGARVPHLLCVFTYLPGPELHYLTDADTLLTVGRQKKYIGPRQEQAARSFLEKLARDL